MRVLVTGAAGFIGFHLAAKLVAKGHAVVGLDNLNDYYDPRLKEDRIKTLRDIGNFEFVKADIADSAALHEVFSNGRFTM